MSYWSTYAPDTDSPWNLVRAVHLHRRAGFGATWAELQRDLSEGPQAAVTRVLQGSSRSEGVPSNFEELSTAISAAAVGASDESRLKAWWVYRCLFTPDPLGERLTLMWHNHFATSLRKVKNPSWMLRQNHTFRQYARGDFESLLNAMFADPALLFWLDAPQNRAGHPNENLARESMELFALGIGNYSEQDVREAARALTGIKIEDEIVQEDHSQHDGNPKTIFNQTGPFHPKDLPGLLSRHLATPQRLAWRLCAEFFGESIVPLPAIEELATGLRAHDLHIEWAVETILRSGLFFGQNNLANRVSDPASFLLTPLRALECFQNPPSTLALSDTIRRMGLDLFDPPNVGGWTGGRAWLSTRTVLARTSAVTDFVHGRLQLPTAPVDLALLTERHGVAASLSEAIHFFGNLFWGSIDTPFIDELKRAVRDEPDQKEQFRQVVVLMLTRPQAQFH